MPTVGHYILASEANTCGLTVSHLERLLCRGCVGSSLPGFAVPHTEQWVKPGNEATPLYGWLHLYSVGRAGCGAAMIPSFVLHVCGSHDAGQMPKAWYGAAMMPSRVLPYGVGSHDALVWGSHDDVGAPLQWTMLWTH